LEAILNDVVWSDLGVAVCREVDLEKVDRVDLHDVPVELDKHVLSDLVAVLGTRKELRAGPDTAAARTD
jgi:hypothetical protein